jgi:U3 small nucleolar RNA-associated protein 3
LHAIFLKVVSGDDDLPKRDDIGERRRKHELRVLAGAGIKSEDDVGDEVDNFEADGDADMGNGDVDMGDGDTGDSEDEYYKQVEQRRAAKLAAKAEMYSRCASAL